MNIGSLIVAALTTLAADLTDVISIGHQEGISMAITTRTNSFTNLVKILEFVPIETPCPECGRANHHELRIARMETGYFVSMITVSTAHPNDQPQTNSMVIYRSPKTNFIGTNVVLRSIHRTQPGNYPLPLNPMPTNQSPPWPLDLPTSGVIGH